MDMSDMDSMDMGECSMTMLGNWKTIGSCFLTSSWQITTTAQFAGTCVGVFLMVVLIEAVRRWGREWDRYIVQKAMQDNRAARLTANKPLESHTPGEGKEGDFESQDGSSQVNQLSSGIQRSISTPRGAVTISKIESAFFGVPGTTSRASRHRRRSTFRPTMLQQAIRSLVYAIQFAGAYIVMLIAMSYNGYILIAIVLGGLVGHFFSTWDSLSIDLGPDERDSQLMGQDGSNHDAQPALRANDAYGNVSGACCD